MLLLLPLFCFIFSPPQFVRVCWECVALNCNGLRTLLLFLPFTLCARAASCRNPLLICSKVAHTCDFAAVDSTTVVPRPPGRHDPMLPLACVLTFTSCFPYVPLALFFPQPVVFGLFTTIRGHCVARCSPPAIPPSKHIITSDFESGGGKLVNQIVSLSKRTAKPVTG